MSTEIVQFEGESHFVMCCDFCGKTSEGAAFLIASPSGKHICDECVELCADIVKERKSDLQSKDQPQ